jgi:serine/threonine protein kinase
MPAEGFAMDSAVHLAGLSAAQRLILEERLVAFDQQWHDGKLGEQVAGLPSADDPFRVAALVELVKIDLERQWQRGNRIGLTSYLARYPELASAIVTLADAESRVRAQFPASAYETVDAAAGEPDGRSLSSLGRYQIVGRLGHGAMGAVYLARDPQLDREVALKVPRFAPGDDALRGRFLREAHVLAALHHPNICPIYDVGTHDDMPFLTMAYLPGGSLAQRLHDRKLTQTAAAELIHTLALALAEVHDRGIIHRDLKPANILFGARGEPVIVDFGLARRAGAADIRLTGAGSILGTPAYMAPEQAGGDQAAVGPACDIYSLGVILYELLSGRLPFEGSLLEVLERIRTRPADPVTRHRPDVHPALDAVCRKALAKRPADRFTDIRDLAMALDAYLRAERSQAASVQMMQPRRSRYLLVAGALLFLIVGSMLGVAGWQHWRPQSDDDNAAKIVAGPGAAGPGGAVPGMGAPGVSGPLRLVAGPPVRGHSGELVGAGFRAGGEIVSGGIDHTVRFWDEQTGTEKADIRWSLGELTLVRAVAPDGRHLLTSQLQSLSLWSVTDRKKPLLQVNPGSPHLDALALAGRGRVIAGMRKILGGTGLRIWDVDADGNQAPWPALHDQVFAVALSGDGRRALSGGADGLRLWDAGTQAMQHHLAIGSVRSVAISPAGDRFLSGSATGTLRLWRCDTAAPVCELVGHDGAICCVAFSPDGRRGLSGGSDRTVRLWDLDNAKELVCLRDHASGITCVAFDAAGQRLLAGSQDGELRHWRINEVAAIPIAPMRSARFNADDDPLAMLECQRVSSLPGSPLFVVFAHPHGTDSLGRRGR